MPPTDTTGAEERTPAPTTRWRLYPATRAATSTPARPPRLPGREGVCELPNAGRRGAGMLRRVEIVRPERNASAGTLDGRQRPDFSHRLARRMLLAACAPSHRLTYHPASIVHALSPVLHRSVDGRERHHHAHPPGRPYPPPPGVRTLIVVPASTEMLTFDGNSRSSPSGLTRTFLPVFPGSPPARP